MVDKLIPDKLPSYEAHRGEMYSLGERVIQTPYGDVEVADAPGYITMLIERPEPAGNSIGFLLYHPSTDPGELGAGLIAQMNAEQARNIATSLVRLAETLAPGSTN